MLHDRDGLQMMVIKAAALPAALPAISDFLGLPSPPPLAPPGVSVPAVALTEPVSSRPDHATDLLLQVTSISQIPRLHLNKPLQRQ